MKKQNHNFMERLGLIHPRSKAADGQSNSFSDPSTIRKIKERISNQISHPRFLTSSTTFFDDRADAGRQLAKALGRYKHEDIIVYAIPRGGVIVGSEVAQVLEAPLDLIFVRKIGHPMFKEYALGAVTDRGVVVWDNSELGFTSAHWRTTNILQEKAEAKRQRQLYLNNREPLTLAGKTAIIIDDGAATGLTILAAIKAIRLKRPSRIVVGVPVIPRDTIEKLIEKVDELVVLHVPNEDFQAVSNYYDKFPQTTDQAVIKSINASMEVHHD